LPSALFVVDILKEHIAIAEAKKLNIPTFAIVDTNSDPTKVDFPIPANDDASKSIDLIVGAMIQAIEDGLMERKLDKDKKDIEDREEHDEMIRVRAESIDLAEEEDDEIVNAQKQAHIKVKASEGGVGEVMDKAKRPRKPATKVVKKPMKN
jgi:small subunit ribosomal protein S2